jgi:hypothetical protein
LAWFLNCQFIRFKCKIFFFLMLCEYLQKLSQMTNHESITCHFFLLSMIFNFRNISVNIGRYFLLLIFPFVIVLLSTFFEYGIYIDALDTSDLAQIKEPFNDYVKWDNQIFYILSFNKVNFLHYKLSKLFMDGQ